MQTHEPRKHTARTVWRFLRAYRPMILASLLLAAVTVLLSLYIPILTGQAVDGILGAGQVDFSRLAGILLKIGIIAAVTALLQWVMNLVNNQITLRTVQDIRQKAFEKLQYLPLSYLDTQGSGDILSRMISDVDQFSDGLLMGFTQLFSGVITIVGTLVFMMLLSPSITLIVILVTPISFLVAAIIAKSTYKMFGKQSKTKAEQTVLVDEMISGQKVVQAFGHEQAAQADFTEVNERLMEYSMRAIFYSSISMPATRFINGLVYAGVGIFGAFSAITGGISVGQLTCFLSYANQYTKPFNEITGVITELQNAMACAARVFDLIDQPTEVPDAPNALEPGNLSGQVALEHVRFSYCPNQTLIEDLNVSVESGQHVAIVGPTGCGKTTLINLLMRFYDICDGRICIDEMDIRNMTRASLRENFGMVLQDTWLKSATIRENIAMGMPEATDEQVEQAARAAHAHGFIRRLPEGYETVLTAGGESLSQGQRQLLCIARVMLCLPPMLILDEATSSIDTRTELKIQSAFATLMKGRTSFIVAHRLSTIREADLILVMNHGTIIEQGTHDSLLQANGFYAKLYNSQFSQ